MRAAWIIVLSACLVACATAKEVRLADGSTGHKISCGGSALSQCVEKTGEICGAQGYQVVNREGAVVPASAIGGSSTSFIGTFGAIGTPNLFVKCK